MKKNIPYFLIMMQSVADLIVGLVGLPSFTILYLRRATTSSSHCAEVLAVQRLMAFPTLLSIATLLVMTVERYFGVLHPLKHRTLITKRRILVFYSCGVSFMFTIVALSTLKAGLGLGTFLSVCLFIFLFVAVFVYTRIFLTIRKRKPPGDVNDLNNPAESTVSSRQRKQNFLKQIKLAKSCFLVVVCFVVCLLGGGIYAAFPLGINKQIIKLWGITMVMLNSSVNSIIFFWTRPLLRNEAKKALRNLCG
jgi:hypothetical protein